MNPADPWAWIGLAGDLIDVAVPFVGGLGEATRAANAALNVTEALDDVHDASKVIDDLAEATIKCDGLCFVAGTKVIAEDGTKNIECVQTGDLVWAWDEATDTVALKEVVETYINKTHELVHVFVDGQEIIATPSHPFYSPVKGWTEAVHLRAGDILVLVNGEYAVVEKVQHEILEAPVTVYNFQVKDYHTYYVSSVGILVHNSCDKTPWKTVIESSTAVNHTKGMSPQQYEAYENVLTQLAKGDHTGLNVHRSVGDLTSADIKGFGRGRGRARVFYLENEECIKVLDVQVGHKF